MSSDSLLCPLPFSLPTPLRPRSGCKTPQLDNASLELKKVSTIEALRVAATATGPEAALVQAGTKMAALEQRIAQLNRSLTERSAEVSGRLLQGA